MEGLWTKWKAKILTVSQSASKNVPPEKIPPHFLPGVFQQPQGQEIETYFWKTFKKGMN